MILYFDKNLISVHEFSIHDSAIYAYHSVCFSDLPSLILRNIDVNVIEFIFKHNDRLEYYLYLVKYLSQKKINNVLFIGFRFYNIIDFKIFNAFGVDFTALDIEKTVAPDSLIKFIVADLLIKNSFITEELSSSNFDLVVSYGMLGWLKNNDGTPLSSFQIENAVQNIMIVKPKNLIVSIKNYDDFTHLNGLVKFFNYSFTFAFQYNGSMFKNQIDEYIF
jgi:hypothetical protein